MRCSPEHHVVSNVFSAMVLIVQLLTWEMPISVFLAVTVIVTVAMVTMMMLLLMTIHDDDNDVDQMVMITLLLPQLIIASWLLIT